MIEIILLLILFFFVVRPAWRVYKAYRDPRKAMEDFLRRNGFDPAAGGAGAGSAGESPRRDSGRKAGWSVPRPRKKKIDPSAGDYTRFTDLPADKKNGKSHSDTSASSGAPVSPVEPESQTVDATWEELP